MSGLTNALSADVMHSVSWTLLQFLWQGTAVAALAAVLMALFRSASSRYVVGVGALFLMLAAPVATFFLQARQGNAVVGQHHSEVGSQKSIASKDVTALPKTFLRVSPLLDTNPWLVEAWLLGVAFFGLRYAGGFIFLERGRRKRSYPPSERVLKICRTLERELGLNRTVQYCECLWLQAPAVIGWIRPIVLLPVTTLSGLSEEQLRSVIAHELAHIRRLDAFVNLFQVAIETLLFYHPAVWWLNKRIRAEREHCCDDVAVALCGNPLAYARALTLMEEWQSAPTLAMAANHGPLAERIFRLMHWKSTGGGARGIGLTGGLLSLTAALVAGNALLEVAYPKPTVHAAAERAVLHGGKSSLSIDPQVKLVHTIAASPQSIPAAKTSANGASKPTPARPEENGEPTPAGTATSYIEGLKAEGLHDLTVEQLVSLKIQDVTPTYVRLIREAGLQVDADKLVAMKIQDVTPEFVHDIRSLGLTPDADQIVALKIQNVDGDYVRGLKGAGIQPDLDQLIALKIQGVTPDYVRSLRDLGVQPDIDELVGMRIQGITPEYVRDIRALGLAPSGSELIGMRVQEVTPEYIKALQSAGLKLDVGDIIGAKVQGITAEFIEKARKHGFQNLSLQKLIQLKQLGIVDTSGDL
jgi:beta-lactamase regulating signal transducer with metallopeptidase domain